MGLGGFLTDLVQDYHTNVNSMGQVVMLEVTRVFAMYAVSLDTLTYFLITAYQVEGPLKSSCLWEYKNPLQSRHSDGTGIFSLEQNLQRT